MKTQIRQLSNGKWVAEIQGWFSWRALDAVNPGYLWSRGDDYYRHCWVKDETDAKVLIEDYRALKGE